MGAGEGRSEAERALSALLARSHRLHPDLVGTAIAETAPGLGLGDVRTYVVDADQRVLICLPGPRGDVAEPLGVDTTLAGRAFRTEEPVESVSADPRGDGRRHWWVPILDGAERLGVIEAWIDAHDPHGLARAMDLATIAGSLIVSKQAFGDHLVLLRRLKPMVLAAELRWSLLPPLTYANDAVAIAGILQPAYEIAGDAFDYAVNDGIAHVAILDAVGHGLEASRIANLAVGAYRNSRRGGLDLLQAFQVIDEVVADQFGGERFVTGQLARLDLATGLLTWLNAGHPKPVLVRNGRVVGHDVEVRLPLGLGDVPTSVATLALQPDDTVLFFTDGVVEARSDDGEEFGQERLEDLLVRAIAAEETPAETVRRLCHAVLAHEAGTLRDDATLLLLRWVAPCAPDAAIEASVPPDGPAGR